jgi:hypothetical protein
VGPLPVSAAGFTYLFTIIDRSSRWLEVIPLKAMDAASCVDALVKVWIARFGVPTTLTSDRGTQFCLELWANLCRRLDIQHIKTTAYHPQANGMLERAHRQLKDALRSRLAGDRWPDHLPWELLGLRAAPKDTSGVSSAELLCGVPLTLPGQLLVSPEPPAVQFVEMLRSTQPPPTRPLTKTQSAATIPASLLSASFVYVKKGGVVPPLAPLYQGPFAVIKSGPKFFHVSIGGRREVITVDRLKQYLGAAPVETAAPAARGRPRRKSMGKEADLSPALSPPLPPSPRLGGGSCGGKLAANVLGEKSAKRGGRRNPPSSYLE